MDGQTKRQASKKKRRAGKIPKHLIRPDGGLYDLPDELQKLIVRR